MSDQLRISGLASGMNTDKIVDKLMKAERIPLTRLKQQQQILEWRRDDYREMNKLLLELKNNVFDLGLQSSFQMRTVSSSNEAAVEASAISLEGNTTTQISVSQLAKVSTGVSGDISGNNSFDPDAVLSSQTGNLNSSNFGTQFTLSVFQPDGTMKNQVFQIDPSQDSLNDILERINSSDLGVTAFYDKVADKVSIATNHTGNNKSGAEISVTGDGGFFSDVLQFSPGATGSIALADGGQNAVFTLNGLTTERTSNQFTINDVEYHLKQTTNSPVTITTATDVDAIYEKVKAFVDLYNETIQKINDELNEERYRDYKPLTDAQREEFSDHEAELWREKAMSGMLANDMILPGGLGQMRIDIYSAVQGVSNSDYNQLAEIGITVSNDYREHGKLVLDEDKLRSVIADDPDAVMALFTNNGDVHGEMGIAERLEHTLDNTMERIEQKAGNSGVTDVQFFLGRRLDDIGERIDAFQDHLSEIEDRYYRQFTAMEQAIQRANQQSAFIMSAFAGK
ncbi:MAG TPA: flagellar hook-associated protein 2 [Bacillales bacterium]|nr:flagellar hook-associated protein 2 [Bacillales bacterium]